MDVIGAVIDVDVTFMAAFTWNRCANGPILVLLLIDEDLLKVVLVLLELFIMTKHSIV